MQLSMTENIQNIQNIQQTIIFLNSSQKIGSHELLYPLTGFRFKRSERTRGEYYREPYPLTLTLFFPNISNFPDVTYPLTQDNVKEIISALEAELRK